MQPTLHCIGRKGTEGISFVAEKEKAGQEEEEERREKRKNCAFGLTPIWWTRGLGCTSSFEQFDFVASGG